MMTNPIQNAQKLPVTKPDRMFSDAPPWPEQVTISFTCRDLVLTKILVNSMMSGPARVPQATMPASTHHRFEYCSPVVAFTVITPPSRNLLATKATAMETTEVSHTRFVSGCSQLKSFLLL